MTRRHRSLALALLIAAAVPAGAAPPAAALHDGTHDFDFLFGRWKMTLRKLQAPLHGSHEWVDFTGTSVARPILGGVGNVEEFEADGPSGHISALTVRAYSTTAHQWAIYWLNAKAGRIDLPTVGEFKNGRGEFYDQELFEGRSILVRYVWSNITPTAAHFEQSFSPDGGKTWEVNWISQITKIDERAAR